MENHRRTINSSGDQFEFGNVTNPDSPNSPADHLFFNGKLLPHVFPIQSGTNFSYSRSTSGTSSRNSMTSSRSDSTNGSARTSTSEVSDRNRFSSSSSSGDAISPARTPSRKDRNRPPVLSSHRNGDWSSQKWRFIAAAPDLKYQGSRSRKVDVLERKGSKRIGEDSGKIVKSCFGSAILKSFVSACKECHAIKSSNEECVRPTSLDLGDVDK